MLLLALLMLLLLLLLALLMLLLLLLLLLLSCHRKSPCYNVIVTKVTSEKRLLLKTFYQRIESEKSVIFFTFTPPPHMIFQLL